MLSLTIATIQSLVARLAVKDGGFTVNVKDMSEPKTGFALSIYPDRSKGLDTESINAVRLADYIDQNTDLLEQDGNMLGAWHDPKTGRVFFDISKVTNDEVEAKLLATSNDQVAYFDIAAGKSVDVNRQATSGGATSPGDDEKQFPGHDATTIANEAAADAVLGDQVAAEAAHEPAATKVFVGPADGA